jgi:poly-gamma-glutamate capsule biosynthesis protein CapA/YwtB (metallophosphatase superfamily)
VGGRRQVTLFLCGDVMLGRGVDQILPFPGDPELREPVVRDAREYVAMAETVSGPVPWPAGFAWPWGEVPALLERVRPDARVVNLETSVTTSGAFAPGKSVHYRMNPANVPAVAAAGPDVCVLANNHVLDFGRAGLRETLDVLAAAGLRTAGAGPDAEAAGRPAVVPVGGNGGRVLVFACGMRSSGIPGDWAAGEGAGEDAAGVALVHEASRAGAAALAERIRRVKRPGDVAVVSVHWGGNWGYGVSAAEKRWAHDLIDGGADLVHGHSSHHPRPAEIYRGKLVLYGCGDFVDDYEGIGGHQRYRDDLRPAYLVSLDPDTGLIAEAPAAPGGSSGGDGGGGGVRIALFQAHRMRLWPASRQDTEWLRAVLDGAARDLGLGTRLDPRPDGTLALRTA